MHLFETVSLADNVHYFDGESRDAEFRALLAQLDGAGTRYILASRTVTDSYGDTVDSDLAVIVKPDVSEIVAILDTHTQVRDGGTWPSFRRYYGVSMRFDGYADMTDSYCVDVHGATDSRLDIIERAARIRTH